MDFSKVGNEMLVANAVFHAKSERKRMHIVLLHIAEIEARGIYAEYGYSNMCKFVSEVMGYGSKPAYERWSASKFLREVPALSEQLQEGVINLTQISQVRSCLIQDKKVGKKMTTEKVSQVFEKIAAKSNFETKQILAQTFDRPIETYEKVEPQKDGMARFTTSFSPEMLESLEILRSLSSNKNLSGNIEELLLPLVQKEIARIKGHNYKKGVTASRNEFTQNQFESGESQPQELVMQDELQVEVMLRNFGVPVRRLPLAVKTWRSVMERAHYQCEFVSLHTGKKGGEVRYLEVDHKIPVAFAGTNRISNLQVLCRTHNQMAAKEMGLMKKHS